MYETVLQAAISIATLDRSCSLTPARIVTIMSDVCGRNLISKPVDITCVYFYAA